MSDERSDIARYIDALSSPVELDEITGRARPARSRPRRAAVFALAAALVAVITAAVVTTLSGRVDEPARTHPTAVHPAPAPTSTTTTAGSTASDANAVITSTPLPKRYWITDISASDLQLLLTGQVASDSNESQTCAAATVDPGTLRFAEVGRANCEGFTAPGGETVVPVYKGVPSKTCCTETVSIARRDPRTGTTTNGPVVMTYGAYSDTRPITAYGGDWLWIYAVQSTNGPEVLQVSRSTGVVVNTVKTPQLYRPILAANDDGLWIGNSTRGGQCCPTPSALSFVAARAHVAVTVPVADAHVVLWLHATGHHVWTGVGPDYTRQTFMRFDGTDLRPVFQVEQGPFSPDAVVGDEAGGLWALVANRSSASSNDTYREDVIRIDPNTGRETRLTTLPPFALPTGTALVDTPPTAFFRGSLFVMEPPYRANGYLGYSTLVRVTPRP